MPTPPPQPSRLRVRSRLHLHPAWAPLLSAEPSSTPSRSGLLASPPCARPRTARAPTIHLPGTTRRPDAGLTLLEVLVVLAIIALVTTLATPRLMETYGRAKSQAAGVQVTNVAAAVQVYSLDTGQLPSQGDGLGALMAAPPGVENWQGPYIDADALKDPWGRDWIYRQPGTEAPFEVLSYGADGQAGGTSEDADISS